MASRGRAARARGLNFEREIARRFVEAGFPRARRQLENHAADAHGVDLQNTEPFFVQCKKTAKYVPINTITEVQCTREFGEIPVLIAAGDNQEALVVIPLDDFFKLIRVDK